MQQMSTPKTAGDAWPSIVKADKHVVIVEDGQGSGDVVALAVSENDARYIAHAMSRHAIMDTTLRLVERHLARPLFGNQVDAGDHAYILARVRAAIKDPTP
jgi:hypothetical protein